MCSGEHSHCEVWWHRLVVSVTQCHGWRGKRCSLHTPSRLGVSTCCRTLGEGPPGPPVVETDGFGIIFLFLVSPGHLGTPALFVPGTGPCWQQMARGLAHWSGVWPTWKGHTQPFLQVSSPLCLQDTTPWIPGNPHPEPN